MTISLKMTSIACEVEIEPIRGLHWSIPGFVIESMKVVTQMGD